MAILKKLMNFFSFVSVINSIHRQSNKTNSPLVDVPNYYFSYLIQGPTTIV